MRLTHRDHEVLSFIERCKAAPLDVVAMRYFLKAPGEKRMNKAPVAAAKRRLEALEKAGYLKGQPLKERGEDGRKLRLFVLGPRAENRLEMKSRRVHPRHLAHHLTTLRFCEKKRQEHLGADPTYDYLLEHELIAEELSGKMQDLGNKWGSFPDAAFFGEEGTRTAVEYVTQKYSDEQIREKAAALCGYEGAMFLADLKRTAQRIGRYVAGPSSILVV